MGGLGIDVGHFGTPGSSYFPGWGGSTGINGVGIVRGLRRGGSLFSRAGSTDAGCMNCQNIANADCGCRGLPDQKRGLHGKVGTGDSFQTLAQRLGVPLIHRVSWPHQGAKGGTGNRDDWCGSITDSASCIGTDGQNGCGRVGDIHRGGSIGESSNSCNRPDPEGSDSKRIGEAKNPGPGAGNSQVRQAKLADYGIGVHVDARADWCRARGFEVDRVRGDGNCLYTALGRSIGRDQAEVRADVVDFALHEWRNLGDIGAVYSLEDFVAETSGEGVWGGEAQIIVWTKAIGRRVVVHSLGDTEKVYGEGGETHLLYSQQVGGSARPF